MVLSLPPQIPSSQLSWFSGFKQVKQRTSYISVLQKNTGRFAHVFLPPSTLLDQDYPYTCGIFVKSGVSQRSTIPQISPEFAPIRLGSISQHSYLPQTIEMISVLFSYECFLCVSDIVDDDVRAVSTFAASILRFGRCFFRLRLSQQHTTLTQSHVLDILEYIDKL